MTQLEETLNDHLARLGHLRFLGTQMDTQGQPSFALLEDAKPPLGTGSSFAIHPGETISEALSRVQQRYQAAPPSSLFLSSEDGKDPVSPSGKP